MKKKEAKLVIFKLKKEKHEKEKKYRRENNNSPNNYYSKFLSIRLYTTIQQYIYIYLNCRHLQHNAQNL